MATRPLIYSPWTPDQEERLKLLAARGASALRAAAALNRPMTSVRIWARKLGVALLGVRAVRRKLASALNSEGDHVWTTVSTSQAATDV